MRPWTIFNLSAYGGYERQSSPRRIHEVNYTGNINLINSLMDLGCDAFVTAGSSSEYGINCAGPSELDELRPNSDYAVSKVASAFLIKYYGQIRHSHAPTCVLTPYTVPGRTRPPHTNPGQKWARKKIPPFCRARYLYAISFMWTIAATHLCEQRSRFARANQVCR